MGFLISRFKMITFEFTNKALGQFQKFENPAKKLIQEKFQLLKNPEIFAKNSKKLTDLEPATHRIRLGRYRALLKQISPENYLVLKIAHRKDIYR